jgi:hypothetical protein
MHCGDKAQNKTWSWLTDSCNYTPSFHPVFSASEGQRLSTPHFIKTGARGLLPSQQKCSSPPFFTYMKGIKSASNLLLRHHHHHHHLIIIIMKVKVVPSAK